MILGRGVALKGAGGGSGGYRYYRWNILDTRDGWSGGVWQAGELRLLDAGSSPISWPATPTVTQSLGGGYASWSGEEETHLVDGNASTKVCWIPSGAYPLGFDIDATSAITPYGFDWATANDSDNRDAVTWDFYGSADGTTWTLLHSATGATITSSRSTYTGPWMF